MRLLLSLVLVLSSANIYGQSEKKLDFVLVVDDDIFIQYTKIKLIRYSNNGVEEFIATYWPGSLSISVEDYKKLINQNTDSISLNIVDDRYVDGKRKEDHYEIKYKKQWLEDYFNVLRIYNLSRRNYGKLFAKPRTGKKYVYELDSPSYTFHLIRTK